MFKDMFKLEERKLAESYIEEVSRQSSITKQEVAYWNYELFIEKIGNPDETLKGLVSKIHEEAKIQY